MTSNLDRFKAIDDAYNARDWEAYSSRLDQTFSGWMLGEAKPEGKAEHVQVAKRFCAVSVDNRVHNAPYIVALSKDDWTCTIARLTGTMTGTLPTADGKVLEPTHRTFDTKFATFARWSNGKIVEEYEFLDVAGIMRQIGATQ